MRFDAVVVGGSFAGLSAATYIARTRRSVLEGAAA
jgi:thioredoxin reductase